MLLRSMSDRIAPTLPPSKPPLWLPATHCPLGESLSAINASDACRPERDIDTIDRRTLRVLQADGRISNLKLAE